MKCEQCGANFEQNGSIYCDSCINVFNADMEIDIDAERAEFDEYMDEMP